MEWGFPALVLVIGLVVLALLLDEVKQAESNQIELETSLTARQVSLRLQAWIDDRLTVPQYLASRDYVSEQDVKDRFRDLAGPFLYLYSGIQALNYVNPDGVIEVVVPEAPNRRALGMDLEGHPSTGVTAAVDRARNSNAPTATPVIDLYQGGAGMAIYQAIRDDEGELLGLLNCVYRLDTLVAQCLHEQELRDHYRFRLVDENHREAYLHDSYQEPMPPAWPHAVLQPVMVVDRTWSLLLAPTPTLIAHADSPADDVQAVVGALLLLALVVTFHFLVRRQFALQESRSRYQLLVENQTDLVAKLDCEGHLVYVSPSYCRLYGVTESDVLGKEFLSRVHEDDREISMSALKATRQPPDYEGISEHRSRTRHGWRWMSWTGSGLRDETGEVVATIATGRDITHQRNLEEQLRQGQKMQAVGQLAGGIAHDFNNLLQAIQGYLELLEQNPTINDKNARDDLDAVKRSAQRASKLTRQLLAFSRQQVRSVKVHDLGLIVREITPLLQRLMDDSITLDVATPEFPTPVMGDRGQLEQVVMNLCVNARDAMDDGGTIDMCVKAPEDEDRVYLLVTDNGHGITADVQKRMFEPFYTTKDVGQGTGLGLATVYGIVEHHQGELQVKSEPGQGACFTVVLPLAADEPDPDDDNTKPEVRGGNETLLLAEDEDALRDLTARVLRQAGYQVVTAIDGEHAVQQFLENGTIDLAVMDVMMPRMNGREAARRLAEHDTDLPVVFISGHPGGQSALQEDDVLLKPFDAVALLRRVRVALDRR